MQKIRIGVIPAAGKGARIGPLSEVFPKPMTPVFDRPILHHIIQKMVNSGVEEVFIIVGHKKDTIKEYFGDGKKFNLKINYIEQTELKGIAHAISLVENYINEPFIVVLGDDFTITNDFSKLINAFFEQKALVVEGVVEEENVDVIKRTCNVVLDEAGKIKKIIEKPKELISKIRGCGVYIFDPEVFDYIKKTPLSSIRNEIEITNTIDVMARKNKAYGVFFGGANININTREDLFLANVLFAKYLSETGEMDLDKIWTKV